MCFVRMIINLLMLSFCSNILVSVGTMAICECFFISVFADWYVWNTGQGEGLIKYTQCKFSLSLCVGNLYH